MSVTCPECESEVPYREIDADTKLQDGEFVTTYRCPYCNAPMTDVGDA